MSIEKTIESLTSAIEGLTAALTNRSATVASVCTPAAQSAEVKATSKKTTAAKTEAPAATPAVTQEIATSTATPETATASPSEGVRFVHIPKHNTVARVEPGHAIPALESAVEITEFEYEELKGHYAKKIEVAAPAAASTAPSVPAEQATASQPTPTAAVSFQDVVAKLQALAKAKGRDAVLSVLAKFNAANVPALQTGGADLAAVAKATDEAAA